MLAVEQRRLRRRFRWTMWSIVAVGAPVPVLVDPAHPTTVYTVHDVA